MSNIKIPSFLTKLDREEKVEMTKQWSTLKGYKCFDLLQEHLENQLEQLISTDETSGFASWFQTKWNLAKSHGKREILRKLIKDLK